MLALAVYLLQITILLVNSSVGPSLFLEIVLITTIMASIALLVPQLELQQNTALWMSLGLHLFMSCTLGRDTVSAPNHPLVSAHSCVLPVLLALNCISRDYIRSKNKTDPKGKHSASSTTPARQIVYMETAIVSLSAMIYFSHAHGLMYVVLQYLLLRRTVDEYYWLFKQNGFVESVLGMISWVRKFMT